MNPQYIQFFTATILWWKKLLKPDKYKQMIVESMGFLVKDGRVKIHGFVIMPNHIHVVWRIHEDRVLKDTPFGGSYTGHPITSSPSKTKNKFFIGAKRKTESVQ